MGEGLAALALGGGRGMGHAPALGAAGPLGQGQPDTVPAKPLAAPMHTQPVIIGSGAGASAVRGG